MTTLERIIQILKDASIDNETILTVTPPITELIDDLKLAAEVSDATIESITELVRLHAEEKIKIREQ